MRCTRDTETRRTASPRLRAQAPPARHAHQRSSSAGADMTPGLELAVALHGEQGPEQRHATDVVVRAVDRVDVPAHRRVAGLRAVLLADEPWSGNAARSRSRIRASIAVSAWVTNVRSGLVSIVRSRRKWARAMPSASSQAAWATSSQPRSSASRPAAQPRRPVAPERRAAHARIRSPAGSHKGSRMTSKPIQSPNTSTSPRVPMAGVGRQVRVGDRALDREAVAARGDPPDHVAAEPHRLVAEADGERVVEDQAAQPLARPGRLARRPARRARGTRRACRARPRTRGPPRTASRPG